MDRSQHMRQLWKKPAFVDGQVRRMVHRWDNQEYRRRQNLGILAGRRQMPFARAPRGDPCEARGVVEGHGEVACLRQDEHEYHVGTVGAVETRTLRLVGWEE